MKKETRKTIYAGVNFIVSPPPGMGLESRLEFQRQLSEENIELTDIKFDNQRWMGVRSNPMPIQVTVGLIAPAIGQLLIVVPELGGRTLEHFGEEACDIARSFSNIWPKRQILGCDVTIRDLYDADSEHAFQEIWEGLLHQPTERMNAFGRPILGGGLRFVMPQIGADTTKPVIEVKVESFLQDTHKIFLDVSCNWPTPQPLEFPLDPEIRINYVDNFIQKQVIDFIIGG
ncbi:MAG TPA: hypothetical protein VKF38_03375 [Anaerolineaceae bacterium]|nr:hypothetical protein [Anaerolineaceae bacterium]